ncbi:uncharacterized protein LOC120358505 [Solenopsis invicta]|uniref:uncharacterized protein LOC120358505 n=1 Tax=Solenopsis invicta TaxID=13686 RepID=UPI00193CC9B9|nr:uncharacterized protein LOC120358505 [Solenopsis invicta]
MLMLPCVRTCVTRAASCQKKKKTRATRATRLTRQKEVALLCRSFQSSVDRADRGNNGIKNVAEINALMKRGGKNVEDLTNNIMTKVFTNELASNFSMQGKQKKKALLDFTVTSCIEAIMACENSKEDYIQKQMGKWLANAPVRLSRNRTKKENLEAAKTN